MSKERLEELLELHEKAVVAYEDCDFLEMRGYLETLFLEGFIDYLIEQVERVQKLEEENKRIRQMKYHEAYEQGKFDTNMKVWYEMPKLEQQNNRYREALEFYADASIYNFETETDFDVGETRIISEGHIFRDFGRKAREALECEE